MMTLNCLINISSTNDSENHLFIYRPPVPKKHYFEKILWCMRDARGLCNTTQIRPCTCNVRTHPAWTGPAATSCQRCCPFLPTGLVAMLSTRTGPLCTNCTRTPPFGTTGHDAGSESLATTGRDRTGHGTTGRCSLESYQAWKTGRTVAVGTAAVAANFALDTEVYKTRSGVNWLE